VNPLFWIFAIIATLVLGLLMLPRRGYQRWCWSLLVIILVAYFGLYRLTGVPRSVCMLTALSGIHGEYEVVYHNLIPGKGIYLLLQAPGDDSGLPIYLETAWSEKLAMELSIANMRAAKRGGVVMADTNVLSRCVNDRVDPNDPGDASITGTDDMADRLKDKSGPNFNAPKNGTEGGEKTFYDKPIASDPMKEELPDDRPIEVH
jgi:hypothetical protein